MVKTITFLFLVLAVLFAVPRAASADESACTTNLLACFERAAKIDSFWYRWAAGLDCEINYAGCVREAIMGL